MYFCCLTAFMNVTLMIGRMMVPAIDVDQGVGLLDFVSPALDHAPPTLS